MKMLGLSFLKGFICNVQLKYTVIKWQFKETDA